ncbi:unnamed protein product [Lymnaea stagnalis]|uniref:Uncharacterized protein n=1 Tax=Lymnaea stagnalis TaxID=6523 RepID=A0AAV2IMA3_LYMST
MALHGCTFDIILLFGPPIPDKASFVPESVLSSNHATICIETVYQENTSYGLRDVALLIVTNLRQNKQVLAVDEFRLKSVRESLITIIKSKIPLCRVLLIEVIPEYGFNQVMWQWLSACALGDSMLPLKDGNTLKYWFDKTFLNFEFTSGYVQKPSKDEGYSIETLHVPLKIKSSYKIVIHSLFLQWEHIIGDNDELFPQIFCFCSSWAHENPTGRIIVICDGKNVAKGIISATAENIKLMKCLKKLAEQLNHPIFALQILSTSNCDNFCLPPNPGMLAFLQQRHLVDLHSEKTFYIFGSQDHKTMAQVAGVKHLKVTSLLTSPDLVLKGQGIHPTVPAMLKTKLVEEKLCINNDTSPSLPLFDLRHEMEDGHISHCFPLSFQEHVFVKDMSNFCKYQELFVKQLGSVEDEGNSKKLYDATVSEDGEKTNDKFKNETGDLKIPYWMKKRPRKELSSGSSEATLESAKSGFRSLQTIYVMTERELMEMAHHVIHQHEAGQQRKQGSNFLNTDEPG